jgi:hypothetical protein
MGDIGSPSEHCRECARLWQEFVDATNAQLRILGQQQTAVIRQDSAAVARLNQAVAESAARRQVASDAFKAHAATHGDTKFKKRAAE